MKKLVLVFAALSITGCASIISGKTSLVNVTSTPSGAECDLAGHGVLTPGNVSLSKSSDDIFASCRKEGYLLGSTKVESSFNAVTLLDTLWGIPGALFYVIDFSTGAAFEYPEQISVYLTKEPPKPVVFEEPKPITFAPTPVPAKEIVTTEYFKDKKGRCFINDEYGNKQRVEKSFCR